MKSTKKRLLLVVLAALGIGKASFGAAPTVGQPVDIAASAYQISSRPQAGRQPAGKLDRLDEVRRPAAEPTG